MIEAKFTLKVKPALPFHASKLTDVPDNCPLGTEHAREFMARYVGLLSGADDRRAQASCSRSGATLGYTALFGVDGSAHGK